jgi:hypothetical protein
MEIEYRTDGHLKLCGCDRAWSFGPALDPVKLAGSMFRCKRYIFRWFVDCVLFEENRHDFMKIKIARIITRMDLGGAQQAVLYLGERLDPDCFEQIIVTARGTVQVKRFDRSSISKYRFTASHSRPGVVRLQATQKIRQILQSKNLIWSIQHS